MPHAPAGAEAEERLKAQQMLRMLVNRSNSRWVEKVEWEVPYTFDAVRFLKLLGEDALRLQITSDTADSPDRA